MHGIVADQWWDRRTRSLAKARDELLEATTLADEAAHAGHSRVFCLGLDESPASLLAGNSRGQVFWMDAQGLFNTRGNQPEWLGTYNSSRSIDDYHDKKWNAMGAGPDLPPLRTMSCDPKKPEEFLALYRSSPFCQEAQFELLAALLTAEKLGQGDTLDFVFVSLGSMALLGYETGSDSPLMDQMAAATGPADPTHSGSAEQDAGQRQLPPDFRRRAWRAAGTRSGHALAEGYCGRNVGASHQPGPFRVGR